MSINSFNPIVATSWTATASFTLTSLEPYIRKFDAPTQNFNAYVWANSGGIPGSILGTSDPKNASVLSTSSALHKFTGFNVPIVSGTDYWFGYDGGSIFSPGFVVYHWDGAGSPFAMKKFTGSWVNYSGSAGLPSGNIWGTVGGVGPIVIAHARRRKI